MVRKIPRWLKSQLDEAGYQAVAAAVKEVEGRTSAEIVPMIVRRSSAIGHVPMVVLVILVLIFFTTHLGRLQADYLSDHPLWWLLDGAVISALAVWIAGLSGVQRHLTPDRDIQVWHRAELEFYRHGLSHTAGATGILIFLSLMEKKVVVLADKAIAEKLDAEVWQGVVATLLQGRKSQHLAAGFCQAIAQCGSLVAPDFPPSGANPNELKDHLIIAE